MPRLLMYFPENDLALASGHAAYTPPHSRYMPPARHSRYGWPQPATALCARASVPAGLTECVQRSTSATWTYTTITTHRSKHARGDGRQLQDAPSSTPAIRRRSCRPTPRSAACANFLTAARPHGSQNMCGTCYHLP